MAEPRRPLRIERAVIRRSVEDPRIAEGERTLLELDVEKVSELIKQGRGLLQDLERIFSNAPRRRQRRRLRP